MPTNQPLPNPAEQLGAVVSQLFELSQNGQVPPDQRQQLALKAHDLRGDLIGLVSEQFAQETDAYQGAMTSLRSVTDALNEAEQDIQQIGAVLTGADQLAVSLDNLLKEAAKTATAIG